MSKMNGARRLPPCPQCLSREAEIQRLQEENAELHLREENARLRLRLASAELKEQKKLSGRALELLFYVIRSELKRGRPKENGERDAELCRLRNTDEKKWSWGLLGKRYKISRVAARKAYDCHMDELREFVRAMEEMYSRSDRSPDFRQLLLGRITPHLEAAGAVDKVPVSL